MAKEPLRSDFWAQIEQRKPCSVSRRRFRTALSSKLVPPRHPQILQLANNVANCYFYAAKVPGSKKDACWEGGPCRGLYPYFVHRFIHRFSFFQAFKGLDSLRL